MMEKDRLTPLLEKSKFVKSIVLEVLIGAISVFFPLRNEFNPEEQIEGEELNSTVHSL